MTKPLRPWQADCVEQIVDKKERGGKHFFCLAATASGKTFMAAEAAKRLIELGAIDAVLCFCPTNEIQFGIRNTFQAHLQKAFDGSLPSIGSVHTYQGMLFQSKEFWNCLSELRVMIIFDEIHHCAGTAFTRNNAWGSQILHRMVEEAAFVLCLSGTPWRSDKLPITTAIYDQCNNIQCDYTYGLADAVHDGVCREPTIVLVDNDNINVEVSRSKYQRFTSIPEALKDSHLQYADFLMDETVQQFMLKKSIDKLNDIRRESPDAAGLVVASSVEHALLLTQLLKEGFHQSAEIVSYLHPKSPQTIERFRHNKTRWIVSVGMVSEGTDIPRLQVCCHLSHIRTEVYFRQILGRILRITNAPNQEAFLYMLAEPNLSQFAKRLQVDVPQAEVNFESMKLNDNDSDQNLPETIGKPSENLPESLTFSVEGSFEESSSTQNEEGSELGSTLPPNLPEPTPENPEALLQAFELRKEHFIEQLINLYDDEEISSHHAGS